MKKLLAFAIGLGVVLGTISFAADDTTDTTKKMDSKKKTKKIKDGELGHLNYKWGPKKHQPRE